MQIFTRNLIAEAAKFCGFLVAPGLLRSLFPTRSDLAIGGGNGKRSRFMFAAALFALNVGSVNAQTSAVAPYVGEDLSGKPCTGNPQGYGPYDYTDPANRPKHLPLVEGAHFTAQVESLQKGRTALPIAGDLDYTLRAFPNNHRALYTAIRYWFQGDESGPYPNTIPPPECYLQRAKNFAPHDPKILLLEGVYLHKRGRLEDAKKCYEQAESRLDYKGELYYNMGLLSIDLKEFDEARDYADKARAVGYPLDGVNQKLKRLGYE